MASVNNNGNNIKPDMQAEYVRMLEETRQRLMTQVGHSGKKRHCLIKAYLAPQILLKSQGLTIELSPDSDLVQKEDFESIWQMIGWLHPIVSETDFTLIDEPKGRQRWNSAANHDGIYETSFNSLRDSLMEDYGVCLIMTPRNAEKRGIGVITLDADYSIGKHKTAKEVSCARDIKRLTGSNTASFKRLLTIGGDEHLQAGIEAVGECAVEVKAAPRKTKLDASNGKGLKLTPS